MSSSVSSLIDVLLTAIRYAARDTNCYEFARPDGAVLPAAEPGAHIDLHLANGMVRQYSLTRPDPAPTQYILGIKRDACRRLASVDPGMNGAALDDDVAGLKIDDRRARAIARPTVRGRSRDRNSTMHRRSEAAKICSTPD